MRRYADNNSKLRRPPLLRASLLTSKSPLPARTKFSVDNKRELMNCIAYSPGNQRDAGWSPTLVQDDSLSLSSTSSDITDVSPSSSLSDFFLTSEDQCNAQTEPECEPTAQCTEVVLADHDDNNKEDEIDNNVVSCVNNNTDETTDLRLLSHAIDQLETQNCRTAVTLTRPRVINLSFSTHKAREIARENANLLTRLQRARSRGSISAHARPGHWSSGHLEASAAINRRQKQRQIQHENMILLRKITSARATCQNPASTRAVHRPSSAANH